MILSVISNLSLSGKLISALLIGMSVLSLSCFFERMFVLLKELRAIHTISRLYQNNSNIDAILNSGNGIINKIFGELVRYKNVRSNNIWHILKSVYKTHRQSLEREMYQDIGLLESFITLSPLIGLFGTVLGVMEIFIDISNAKTLNANLNTIGPGIGSALVTTAAGMIVAVENVIFASITSSKIQSILGIVDKMCIDIINTQVVNHDKAVSNIVNLHHSDTIIKPVIEKENPSVAIKSASKNQTEEKQHVIDKNKSSSLKSTEQSINQNETFENSQIKTSHQNVKINTNNDVIKTDDIQPLDNFNEYKIEDEEDEDEDEEQTANTDKSEYDIDI